MANDVGPKFTRSQSTGLSGLGRGNAGVLSHAATKAKKVLEFKDAIKLIWSALPEKAIDNSAKDHRKRLQACVSANGGHFKRYSAIIHTRDTNCYIII